MPLHTLPYDLLFNVSRYLDIRDIHALQLTSKSLYDFTSTRPVYRNIAHALLSRSRPLLLKGFQRLSDLSTQQLIQSVNRAYRFERAWRVRAPRPISALANQKWYKVISAPPGEEVDWLSPITSSYTLCATKSGKVVCWDVQSDACLAEWNPGEKWELWKCRVEFDERTVYFTMAKVISGSYDDARVMEFILMSLHFPDDPVTAPSNPSSNTLPPVALPVFTYLSAFPTTGVVMNVFLLDPPNRLLSAFVWVAASNTIGLYVLLDWAKDEYVFVDTGVICLISSNWSCILHENQIVIHSEESDAAYQHFYPLEMLQGLVRRFGELEESTAQERGAGSKVDDHVNGTESAPSSAKGSRPRIPPRRRAPPTITTRLLPARTIRRGFRFPRRTSEETERDAHIHGHHIPVTELNALHHAFSNQDEVAQLQPGQAQPVTDDHPTHHAEGHQHEVVEHDIDQDIRNQYRSIFDGGDDEVTGTQSHPASSKANEGVYGDGEQREAEEVEEEVFDSAFEILGDENSNDTANPNGWSVEVHEDREDDEDDIHLPLLVQLHVHHVHHHDHEAAPHQHEYQFGNSINGINAVATNGVADTDDLTPSTSTQVASTSAQAIQPSSSTNPAPQTPQELNPNPYPFPPFYPESAHFVRQWWPTLPGVRRMSCTVVLLAAHNPVNHRTRFVLAQHYFGVPVSGFNKRSEQEGGSGSSSEHIEDDDMLKLWYVSTPFEVVCVLDRPDSNETNGGPDDGAETAQGDSSSQTQDNGEEWRAESGVGEVVVDGVLGDIDQSDGDDADIHGGVNERPRPLVAVDFGHAVWVEHCGDPRPGTRERNGAKVDDETEAGEIGESEASGGEGSSSDRIQSRSKGQGKQKGKGKERAETRKRLGKKKPTKCLRFVTFPPVGTSRGSTYSAKGQNGSSSSSSSSKQAIHESTNSGIVRTLDIPDELDLDSVETINIDQSQGAVILSVREGKIFILMYE